MNWDSPSAQRGKMVQRLALLYIVAVAFAVWGFAVGRYEAFPFRIIKPLVEEYDEIRAFLKGNPEEKITRLWEKIKYHRQEKRSTFAYSGFQRRDTDFVDTGFLLISRFSNEHDQVIVELVRLRDFEKLYTWIPPLDEILKRGMQGKKENSKGGYRVQHPLLLKDGSLVFHSGEGSLVKIDRDSGIVWAINEHFHHSVEMSHDGNLVVPINNKPKLQPLPAVFRDDGYAVITQEGQIIQRYSVGKILMENGYSALFLGVGQFEKDRIHLNDAQPILQDVGEARIGDVALSIRHLSTVLLYRPITDEIVWLKTGPWLNQHDINLLNGGAYSIFGNDVYRLPNQPFEKANTTSEIYVFDPTTGSVKMPYSAILKQVEMYSGTEGRSRILPNGDVYIEETRAMRLLRLSKDKVRWEYVNGVTDKTSGAIHWSRYLTAEEIEVFWE